LGVLKVNATVLSLTSVDIVGTVFGTATTCPKEDVLYTPSNHTVIFPKVNDPTDCIGNLLREYGVPTDIYITYDVNKNTLTIVAEGTDLELTKCTSDFFREKLPVSPDCTPAGTYCGVYQNVAKVKVSIVSEDVAFTSGSVYGDSFSCPNEAFDFSPTTSAITLPKVNTNGDCLGHIMSVFSIDSSQLSIVFDQKNNQMNVKGPSNTKMVLINCPASVEEMFDKIPLFERPLVNNIS